MTHRMMDLEQLVGPETYAQAGLAKLSPNEQLRLVRWIMSYANGAIRFAQSHTPPEPDKG